MVYVSSLGLENADPDSFSMETGKGIKAVIGKSDVLCGNRRLMEEHGISLNPAEVGIKRLSDEGKAIIIVAFNGVVAGLIGFSDELRAEAADVIHYLSGMKVQSVLLTGDNSRAAGYMAAKLGIADVYAELLPSQKVKAISDLQKNGHVVAMIGDGVNDAPSIKNADIGVGMGITGTDVTKNVADMVLADDNFATIVKAVAEGRRIYDNIRRTLQFLLGSNLSEVIAIFTASILGFNILMPSHLLWINLITDSFPAIGLGMEESDPDVMDRPPRDKNEGVFAGGLGINCVIQGFAVAIITLASYFIGEYIENGAFQVVNSADGTTMAFLTLSMAELFHSFNMRSMDKSLLSIKGHNRFLYFTLIGAFLLTVCVLYIPFLSNAFGFEHISLMEFCVALLMAFMIIPIVEIQKLVQRKIRKK